MNNPLIYVDITGEWFGLDDLIGFLIGGTINLISNAVQGNIHSWGDGFAAFGAGGAAGTLALYGPAGWAAGGAIVGGTNSYLGGAKGWDIVSGAGIGAFSGLAGGAAGQWAAQNIGGVVINGLNVTSPVLKGVIGGSIGGASGGYAGGFTAGLIMTGDIRDANKAGLSGLYSGAAIGGATGALAAYRYAKKNDINPWTGKDLNPSTNSNIRFGNNSNQENHAFRHTDELGLNRFDVRNAVEMDLQIQSPYIKAGNPFNQIIVVGGQRIQYTAYKLPDGIINVGRIHGVK